MRAHSFLGVAAVVVVVVAVTVPGVADDRDLLRAEGAPPNVLVMLDSGASMTHDPKTNTLNYLAAGDDDGRYVDFMERQYGATYLQSLLGTDYRELLAQGSKLTQSKRALRSFLNSGFDFNYGFSYYEKTAIAVRHVNVIYRVAAPPETERVTYGLLDGTPIGGPIRMGDVTDARVNNQSKAAAPAYPVRYGADGKAEFIQWLGDDGNWVTEAPNNTQNKDRRIVSFLVDGPDLSNALPLSDSAATPHYYYPAYDWEGLSWGRWVRMALNGDKTWEDVALQNNIDTTDPSWKQTVVDYVLEDITMRGDPWGQELGTLATSNQIGSRVMYVKELLQEYRNDVKEWMTVNEQISRLEYEQQFVLYDHDFLEENPGSNTLSAVDYQGTADCAGYLDTGNSAPIVPIAQPDPTDGDTEDKSWLIESYLRQQSEPVFHFPTRSGTAYLPAVRDHWLPYTEPVIAIGRRPIKDSINEAKTYFEQVVKDWDDPLSMCRMNFIILITDGVETCSNLNAPCSAAANLTDVPVYVIYFGSEENALSPDQSVIKCIADNSGGKYFAADDERALKETLRKIALDIEERTRAFASPIVPSIETTTDQAAYISTFTPKQERSIWRGHLRVYPIDPVTGQLQGLRVDGSPDPFEARWDAGDTLAQRSASSRRIYFGDGSGSAIPGVRGALTYPSGDTDAEVAKRTVLGTRIFGAWSDSEVEKTELEGTINFMRGVQMQRDSLGEITVFGRDPDTYGWCGATGDETEEDPLARCDADNATNVEKLGDIFHSKTQILGRPACYTCWLTNHHGYRDEFFDAHRRRRMVLFVGANDGTLHAFDGGLWDPDGVPNEDPPIKPKYDGGTGYELFAWAPSSVMPVFDDLAYGQGHSWTVDGTPTVADVWIDPVHNGTPSADDREWRTVVLAGQRRGGDSIVCLDVTQPDADTDDDGVPESPALGDADPDTTLAADSGREATCIDGGTGCSGPWPRFMWEFTDSSDEDSNGEPDMGQTWSRPLVGFIKVLVGDTVEERMVAFFGGGYHPDGLQAMSWSGNWIYGVDIETGAVLLKQQTSGMVPGDLGALDLNLDGFLEYIYFGDTSGRLYRIRMGVPAELGNDGRIVERTVDDAVYWRLEEVFRAGIHQPFFMRPSLAAVSVGGDGTPTIVAVIGSGDRDQLFSSNVEQNRFYAIRIAERYDDDGVFVPITDADLSEVYVGGEDASSNYLSSTGFGWKLYLDPDSSLATASNEKTNTTGLIVNQYVIFSTFTPSDDIAQVPIYDENGDVIGYACRRHGNAKTYRVYLYNGNPPEGEDRYIQHPSSTAMATEPVVYVGADGKVHVVQALDNLQMEEPMEAYSVPVRLNNWKEE